MRLPALSPCRTPYDALGTGRSEIRNRVQVPIFIDRSLGDRNSENAGRDSKIPGVELILQETGHAFQVQFIKKQVHNPQVMSLADQVSQEVLLLLGTLHGEMTRLRIQNALGLKGKTNFKSRYLKPALADGLI